MPLFHINALSIQCFAALYAGMSVYCVERFSPNRWLSDVQSSKATTTHLLGVMPEFVYSTKESKEDKNHLLRLVSAVPIGEWGKEFEKRFNIQLLQGFGMTESGMSFWAALNEETCVPGRAGYPVSELYEVRVANPENDEALPVNSVGELLIRPKHAGIFSAGYYKMPEKTVEAWRNLWFHTGDACSFDEKGRMHYFDRIKDCIRRRGENISAFELEQVINSYPEIEESAAIGVKTESSGGEDEVLVCIVKNKENQLNTDHFLSFCQKKLPRFAIPKYIRFVDSIRKTGSGKLSKVDVRKEGLTGDVVTLTPDR
jgi:crotonobetaine/carnitine-CoA ligase